MGLWASLANFQVRDLESPVQIRTDPPLHISSVIEFLVNNGVFEHGRIGYDEIFLMSADAWRLGIETNISPPKSTAESYHVRGRTILVTPNPSAT
jgi:hypothetical protein